VLAPLAAPGPPARVRAGGGCAPGWHPSGPGAATPAKLPGMARRQVECCGR
jgi:hypothetical protein